MCIYRRTMRLLRNERGIALPMALLALLVISTLVIGLNFGAEALANALGMDAARGYVGGV